MLRLRALQPDHVNVGTHPPKRLLIGANVCFRHMQPARCRPEGKAGRARALSAVQQLQGAVSDSARSRLRLTVSARVKRASHAMYAAPGGPSVTAHDDIEAASVRWATRPAASMASCSHPSSEIKARRTANSFGRGGSGSSVSRIALQRRTAPPDAHSSRNIPDFALKLRRQEQSPTHRYWKVACT